MSKKISDLLASRSRPLLSIEFFPPKDHKGFAILGSSIERMRVMRPDFVTVTYGAGGSTRDLSPVVSEVLGKMGFSPIMPHLTLMGSSRSELEQIIDKMYDAGYRNIMAIRGDAPADDPGFRQPPDALKYAAELVALIKKRHPDACCGVAGYPETHPEAETPEADILHLKEKINAGGSFVVTQLFYDNAVFFDFVERCRRAGITVPIIPGLLPAISLNQAKRMTERCKASFPADLAEQLEKAGGTGPVAEAIGIQWTVMQIDGLLNEGVPGVHLYILNRAKTALAPALEECLSRWR